MAVDPNRVIEAGQPAASDRATQARGPRLPDIPGPIETAVTAWRALRRMSTALVLLLILASVSVVATFIPQEPVVPTTVDEWRAGLAGPGEQAAEVFDTLQLFDIFGSTWFAVLVALLFISLTGCLIPRYRAFAKVARRPPAPGRNLGRLTHHVVLDTPLDGDAALATAQRILRRRRFRQRRTDHGGTPQVAAERGHWREGGSLAFHTAFYVLLIGVVIGKGFGFEGQINLVEGASFADTRIAYDVAEAGRWFDLEDHTGFVGRLDSFDVSYYPNFTPREFVSTLTLRGADGQPVPAQTRVNHPASFEGMKLYQIRFGFAPRVIMRGPDGQVLFDEAVSLADAGGGFYTNTAKVAVGDPQIALDLVMLPDAELTENGPVNRSPMPNNPRLIAQLYVGEDLGLDRPVPASQFDRSVGPAGPPAILSPGERGTIATDQLSIEFVELKEWSGFQVSHAPGRWLLLLSAILLLVGLVPSLYSYRRRVWVEALQAGDRTQVVLAGVALQRKPAFEEEFEAIEASLRTALTRAAGSEGSGSKVTG